MSFRILHLINRLGASGAEMMLFNLALKLRDKGVEQEFLTLLHGGSLVTRFREAGFPVEHIGMKQGVPSLGALLKIRKEIAQRSPDVLFGWLYHSCVAAGLAAPRAVPLIWGIHHALSNLREEKLLTRFLIKAGPYFKGKVSHYVYVSETSAEHHYEVGYPRENAEVIPNGFDLDRFCRDEDVRAEVRAELGLREEQIVFGSAARFNSNKNQVGLVEALGGLAAPNAALLMVGREVDGNNAGLKQVIDARGLKDRVILLGERSDMTRLMNGMDVYVSASKWGESFPLVLGEAMATQVPCISTDLGDCREIVGDTGRVVRPDDVSALRDAMAELCALSPEERAELGRKARRRVEENYNLDRIADRYLAVCRAVVARKRV